MPCIGSSNKRRKGSGRHTHRRSSTRSIHAVHTGGRTKTSRHENHRLGLYRTVRNSDDTTSTYWNSRARWAPKNAMYAMRFPRGLQRTHRRAPDVAEGTAQRKRRTSSHYLAGRRVASSEPRQWPISKQRGRSQSAAVNNTAGESTVQRPRDRQEPAWHSTPLQTVAALYHPAPSARTPRLPPPCLQTRS